MRQSILVKYDLEICSQGYSTQRTIDFDFQARLWTAGRRLEHLQEVHRRKRCFETKYTAFPRLHGEKRHLIRVALQVSSQLQKEVSKDRRKVHGLEGEKSTKGR